jgi:hypothetical protein
VTISGYKTGTPKDKDEVDRREVCECDGWVCVLEVIVTLSRLRLTRKVADLDRSLDVMAGHDHVTYQIVYYESIKRDLKKDVRIRSPNPRVL